MKTIILPIVMVISLSSCEINTATVSSPQKDICLTFVHENTVFSTKNKDVYLYFGNPPVNREQYIRLKWSSIGGVAIYWGTKPLVIRCMVPIVENTIPSSLVDMKTYPEDKEGKTDTMKFVNYGFSELFQGKYPSCK